MSHGLPDYYKGVDIAYQALSELISRPKYGGGIGVKGGVTVTASALNTLVTVAGKGMIYGGFMRTDFTSSQKVSEVQLFCDDQLIARETINVLNKYNQVEPRTFPLSLLKYDDVNFIYNVGISYGLSFETNIILKYNELAGSTPYIEYFLVYALI